MWRTHRQKQLVRATFGLPQIKKDRTFILSIANLLNLGQIYGVMARALVAAAVNGHLFCCSTWELTLAVVHEHYPRADLVYGAYSSEREWALFPLK
jgi:hypothetical protein